MVVFYVIDGRQADESPDLSTFVFIQIYVRIFTLSLAMKENIVRDSAVLKHISYSFWNG